MEWSLGIFCTCTITLDASELDIIKVEAEPPDVIQITVDSVSVDPSLLVLDVAPFDSPLQWVETTASGVAGPEGQMFTFPLDPAESSSFLRIRSREAPSPNSWIRYIAPLSGPEGTPFTLLGERFSEVPTENLVRFETLSETFVASVTGASGTVLTGTVPTGVIPSTIENEVLTYRVTVEVDGHQSNGVGFEGMETSPLLTVRPGTCVLLLPPGSGVEHLVVGGGTPPYTLSPLPGYEAQFAQATLDGSVIEVTATSNLNLPIEVQDSSDPPQTASSTVYVRHPSFSPNVSVNFHTLLAGASPGFTVNTEVFTHSMNSQWIELRFDNLGADFSSLEEDDILAIMDFGRYGQLWGYQYLQATEVTPSSVHFRLLSQDRDGGEFFEVAQGRIQRDPVVIRVDFDEAKAETLVPWSVENRLVFEDQIFQLPDTPGETVTLTASSGSVSVDKNRFHPMYGKVVQTVSSIGVPEGAPRLHRVLPVHASAGRFLKLYGSGFDPNRGQNSVTFAGPDGTRIEAEVESVEGDHLRVAVPREAASGPVRVAVNGLESNDFLVSVFFRADPRILFTAFQANTPVSPLLQFSQPPAMDSEYIDTVYIDELSCDYFTLSLDAGSLYTGELVEDVEIGSFHIEDMVDGSISEYPIYYLGEDEAEPGRHLFESQIRTSHGRVKQQLAAIACEPGEGGNGVRFRVEQLIGFKAGLLWTLSLDVPVYHPPAAPGVTVNTQARAYSEQWSAFPSEVLKTLNPGVLITE